jgi:maleate isomerase
MRPLRADSNRLGSSAAHRVGLIVPSSNTTIETEVPAMLARRSDASFSLHSSRAVMHRVEPRSLDEMVAQSKRCAEELADADVDVVVYACLIALMARGPSAHEEAEQELSDVVRRRVDRDVPVISSAGALVRVLSGMNARNVGIMTPYIPHLTEMVRDYFAHYGIRVVDSVSLGVDDNLEVGRLDPSNLPDHIASMDLSDADAIVASACVQMPSLAAVPKIEERFGLQTVTAATATVQELLAALGLDGQVVTRPATPAPGWTADKTYEHGPEEGSNEHERSEPG